jgi:hypothetical protein
MDFSKLKLNKLAESVNPNAPSISMPKSGGTSNAYYGAEGTVNSRGSGEQSRVSTTGRVTRDTARKQQQNYQKSPRQTQGMTNHNRITGPNATPKSGLSSKTTNPTIMSNSYQPSGEHLKELRLEQELVKRLRENKSDWRSELNESAAPEPMDKEMHPYVDVMPHADHNLRTLKKQMAGEVVDKVGKDIKQESVQVDEAGPLIAAAAGKLAGGLAAKGATAGAAKAGGSLAKAASSKLGQTAIQMGANKVGDSVERKMSEEIEELDEAKKKCKSGYTYDKKKKKCVKKKKKKSSSKKSSPTYVYVGRPYYGGGHHHHHHDDDGDKGESNGNGGGGDAGSGDAGGGGGE